MEKQQADTVQSVMLHVSVKLTESRYRMTFPGCVSTLFMTSLVWTPSGDRLKPLSRPTSMIAMPVMFRPRPSDRLHVTKTLENYIPSVQNTPGYGTFYLLATKNLSLYNFIYKIISIIFIYKLCISKLCFYTNKPYSYSYFIVFKMYFTNICISLYVYMFIFNI